MSIERVSFSKNEWELIKCYYLAQREAYKEGIKGKAFKVDKAKLYRKVFNKPDMHGDSACSAARQVLARFEKLSKEEQNKILDRIEIEAKEAELLKKETAVNIVMARAEGAQENIKGYKEGKVEGLKDASLQVSTELKNLDVNSPAGRAKEKNWLTAKLKIILEMYDPDDEKRKYVPIGVAIKGLTEILQEPKFDIAPQITIDNSINELTPESVLSILKKHNIGISSKTLEAIVLKGVGKEEDLTKLMNNL